MCIVGTRQVNQLLFRIIYTSIFNNANFLSVQLLVQHSFICTTNTTAASKYREASIIVIIVDFYNTVLVSLVSKRIYDTAKASVYIEDA